MSELKDSLEFNRGPVVPDAGFYTSPLQARGPKQKDLPTVGSRILVLPAVQTAYNSFGLEGLKSILLQELIKLDWPFLQDEMVYLAEGANNYQDIKRALRATKLLAAQWIEDPRQKDDVREKCQFIFDSISTFGTIQVVVPDNPAAQAAGAQVAFPNTGPLPIVGAEAEHILEKGAALLFANDLQGHYDKLENLLLTCQLAQKQGELLHWTAGREFYLVLVGDLFNRSPYSTWGDGIGWQAYEVLATLQRFMKVAPDNILISYGSYDLDLATKAAFYHPVSGFLGTELGVNAQAQAIPALVSYIQGTARNPHAPDFAWQYDPDNLCFDLKPEFQIGGMPHLTLPANEHGLPDIAPLVAFYQSLFEAMTQPAVNQRPRTLAELDARAATLVPPTTPHLNLSVLKTSLGRCLHFEGLLEGSKTLKFLRERIAGLHVFYAGEQQMFAMHPEIQEISLEMLVKLKPLEDVWEPPALEDFLLRSKVLPQYRLDPRRLLDILQVLKFSRLNDWLGLPEQQFYQRLVQQKQLGLFVPEVIAHKDEKGFLNAYRQFRWELINEDPTGLTGYAINMDGIPRRGEPLMRKLSNLDERTRRSYTKTFLFDLFREELPFKVDIKPEGVIVEYPEANPEFFISLLIDESVAIFKDPKDSLHMPVKHAAWIEYR
jgi:hypothetical protein